jgi:hypothetical protein
MMSLRLLVPLLETRLLCFVCSDAFIGASLFEEVTQKIAPFVAGLLKHIAATENGSLCERMRSSRVPRA